MTSKTIATKKLIAPFKLLSIGLLLGVLSGCGTTTQGGAVESDRKQLLLVSSEQMNQIAAQSYKQLLAEAAEKKVLNTDAALTQRVRNIAQNIIPQTKVFRADAAAWNWEVNVITSDQLNAFCMPGGKIAFFSGLITQLKLTDAEIAIVMGHEIAHALREHSREQLSQALAAQTAIGGLAAVFGLGEISSQVAQTGYQALVASRFSRGDETEADKIGLELTARSGYDPRAGVSLWNKMMQASKGGKPPELLSTHPAEANRIKQIQALLPAVMPLYEAAPKKG